MKVIIAGSRNITSYEEIVAAVQSSGLDVSIVVSGTAYGVDKLGEEWARVHSIPVVRFPADWKTHGKAAGHIRNAEMAEYGDALIAVWDGVSRGTANMIEQMKRRNKPIYIRMVHR